MLVTLKIVCSGCPKGWCKGKEWECVPVILTDEEIAWMALSLDARAMKLEAEKNSTSVHKHVSATGDKNVPTS